MALSTRDKVRLRIGDTDPDAPLLNDEELDDFLDEQGDNVALASADACDAIAAKWASRFDFSTDNQSFSRSQVVEHYRALAKRLRAIGQGVGGVRATRIDGYSQDIDSREVSEVSTSGRRKYGLYGHEDATP